MAENPIGTVADEDRLVPLHARDGAFRVEVTGPLRTVDAEPDEPVGWRLRERGDVDRLLIVPLEDPDGGGALPTSELSESDGTIAAEVPEALLRDGLDLDLGSYDDDNPLLFEPRVVTDGVAVGSETRGEPGDAAERAVELVPVRFSDGTPFEPDPVAESALDSDPVVETVQERERDGDGTPRSEAIDAPVDPDVVDAVVETGGASRDAVVRTLETIDRRDLLTVGDNDSDSRPVVADDRAVIGVDGETFQRRVVARVDADGTTLDAVRAIHARQADDLLEAADASSEGFATLTPVVVQPDTYDESGAQPET